MARRWGGKLPAVREALARRIREEQLAQAAALPTPLHGDAFEVTAVATRAARTLFPVGMRVLPAGGGSRWRGEVSEGMEGVLVLPVAITVKGLLEAELLDLLEAAVALVLDAVDEDSTLGGAVADVGDVLAQAEELEVSGMVSQVLGVTVILRA